MNLAARTIYFGGQSSFIYKGQYYSFADEEQAKILNEAIEAWKRTGSWPGHYVGIRRLDSPGLTTKVSDAELAEVAWKGFRPSVETIFVASIAICFVVALIVYFFLPIK